MSPTNLDLASFRRAVQRGDVSPEQVLQALHARMEQARPLSIFTHRVAWSGVQAALARAEGLRSSGRPTPLFGVPFVVKDNIDVAEMPTTAGCPAYSRVADRTAPAVQRLIDAGAILLGKTNLDQFATGLVGTRSPYGACSSVFDERYISGGSSSGSAVAVALGLASFALGTDTAGSGRVPAAFNHLVGLKPTRGLVSTTGVVPACRSLDCVSIFASSVPSALEVLGVMAGPDRADPYSRAAPLVSPLPDVERVGVPRRLEFFGNSDYERLFWRAVECLKFLGIECREVDTAPLEEAQALLYGGPWIAERYAAVGEFVDAHPDAVDPIVRRIIQGGREVTGVAAFRGQYRLAELASQAGELFHGIDALLMPTTGTQYTHREIAESPVERNANLGRYTNFVNLLDLAAVAFPGGFTPGGLPFGLTFIGAAFTDVRLGRIADRLHRFVEPSSGATRTRLEAPALACAEKGVVWLAVCGAHLSGQPLNHQLRSRGGRLVAVSRTTSAYQLFALRGTQPPKPGLVHAPNLAGPGIEVEVWALSEGAFGSFVAEVPAPMTIGTVTLEDGSRVKSFLCEPFALEGSTDITHLGGWRAFVRGSGPSAARS